MNTYIIISTSGTHLKKIEGSKLEVSGEFIYVMDDKGIVAIVPAKNVGAVVKE